MNSCLLVRIKVRRYREPQRIVLEASNDEFISISSSGQRKRSSSWQYQSSQYFLLDIASVSTQSFSTCSTASFRNSHVRRYVPRTPIDVFIRPKGMKFSLDVAFDDDISHISVLSFHFRYWIVNDNSTQITLFLCSFLQWLDDEECCLVLQRDIKAVIKPVALLVHDRQYCWNVGAIEATVGAEGAGVVVEAVALHWFLLEYGNIDCILHRKYTFKQSSGLHFIKPCSASWSRRGGRPPSGQQ